MARWAAAIGFVAGAVLVTACASTGTSPWWRQTGTSSCGPPALMRVAGQVTWLGNCAAMFVTPDPSIDVFEHANFLKFGRYVPRVTFPIVC